jgi:uncharacterized protein (DUF849 family)
MTPQEIADDAVRCYKAGAAVVHIHMRDDNGIGRMDLERFRETARLIREQCDVVINMTTSGDNSASYEQRMIHISELEPEMASFDAGSFNWMPFGIFDNSPEFLGKLAPLMQKHRVKPEIEIFDSGMLSIANYYTRKGVLDVPAHYQFVLGVIGGCPATVGDLVHLVNKLPDGSTWSAFGVGRDHLKILYATLALGGHVRVGLEDNIYYAEGDLATNERLVQRAVRVIKEYQKEPATPDEAREILGIRKK